jgi:hypothetical protein
MPRKKPRERTAMRLTGDEFVRAALARVELARMVARQGKFSIRSSAQISYASLRG